MPAQQSRFGQKIVFCTIFCQMTKNCCIVIGKDYGCQVKPFFIEIQKFWAWADKLGRQILGHLGYFRPSYQYLFWYSESLVYVFHYSTIISTQKTKPLYPHPQIFIWNWDLNLNLGRKELGIQPSCVLSSWSQD